MSSYRLTVFDQRLLKKIWKDAPHALKAGLRGVSVNNFPIADRDVHSAISTIDDRLRDITCKNTRRRFLVLKEKLQNPV